MIKRISIKNFKSIKSLDLELNSGVTVIVGMNNSGKTNLMEAINVMVNDEYYPSKVSESFYFDEKDLDADFFEITAVVNVESLDNWAKNSTKGKVKVLSTTNPDSNFEWWEKEKLAKFLAKKDLTVTKKLLKDEAKHYVENVYFNNEKNEGFVFEGYGFLSLAYPGAGLGTDKSARASLSTYRTSWFGKLIDNVIDKDMKKKITEVNAAILRNEKFVKIEKNISEGFLGVEQNLIPSILGVKKASISYIPATKNLRTSFEVKVDDGKEEALESKSTGTQFITVIELFLNYIGKFSRNGILSIDEIESTLHPSIAKRVVAIVSKKVNQLIFTTHSKDLLRIVPFANIIKVFKDGNETKAKILNDKLNKLYPLIYQWPEVFFNDTLIVCEGKERALVEAMIASDAIFSKKAAILNLEVINGEGGQVSGFITHASSLISHIKCFFIYDAEYLVPANKMNFSITKKMLEFKGASVDKVAEFESLATNENRKLFLEEFGIFMMIRDDGKNKGGIENYYRESFGTQDLKERPLFLAAELLQNKSIDKFFDSSEYLLVLNKIFGI